ncbi:MAG TPA: T9SS type A sorting domain-containing protein [Saprospiraceae bacterium]|nr:T9SS type A sorting domain-containing protein [Saprospiraceae bacterium]
MRQNNFGRKKRQLKVLAEKLKHLIMYHRVEAGAQIEKLIQKIKGLVQELAVVLSHAELKKILGVAAVFMGISFSSKAHAQSFAAPVANPFGLESTVILGFPAFADLDGDSDLDLLIGEYAGVMKYFQNTGTALNPQFAAPLVNPFGLVSTYYNAIPAFADLDGDGDMDLLVGESYGAIQYFENTGSITNPHFAAPQMNPFGLVSTINVAVPAVADLDGDGDLDLLVGEAYGTMKYFRNKGSISNPQFEGPFANPFGLESTYKVAVPDFADLDNDGDMDLLVGEYYGAMQYFQNTGTALDPQFASQVMNPFGLVSGYNYAFPEFADLDGDGDQDLLVGDYYGVMQYFQNLDITGTIDLPQAFNLKLFPNPVSSILNIDSDENINKVEIFNTLGENVITVENQVSQIKLNQLSPGTYVVKVTSVEGKFITAKIQKQ